MHYCTYKFPSLAMNGYCWVTRSATWLYSSQVGRKICGIIINKCISAYFMTTIVIVLIFRVQLIQLAFRTQHWQVPITAACFFLFYLYPILHAYISKVNYIVYATSCCCNSIFNCRCLLISFMRGPMGLTPDLYIIDLYIMFVLD